MMAWSPYKEETLYNFGSLSLLKNTEKNHHQFVFEKGLEEQKYFQFSGFLGFLTMAGGT